MKRKPEPKQPNQPFETKARTLLNLQSVVTTATVPPSYIVTWEAFARNPTFVAESIASLHQSETLAVRSSNWDEDQEGQSNAGRYRSELGVKPAELARAIEEVFDSYGAVRPAAEVLVQRMIDDAVLAGVAFTHDDQTGAPYFRLEYTRGRDTAAVTSGQGTSHTLIHFPGEPTTEQASSEVQAVVLLMQELTNVYQGTPLDVEFAVTLSEEQAPKVWLLQVRPLNVRQGPLAVEESRKQLHELRSVIRESSGRKPFLLGESTLFSVMTDWNPAEMIGVTPRPLAHSLYRDLITDSIWAYQRFKYGYRDLRGFHLLKDFRGRPYVDVRVSLNSLIPASVSDELAAALVDSYLTRLRARPELHDKVEFKIVISGLTFSTEKRLEGLGGYGFARKDLNDLLSAVKAITQKVLDPEKGLWRGDVARILELRPRLDTIKNSDNVTIPERLHLVLENLRRFGTLPFAGIARASFMGVDLLRSMSEMSILSESELEAFYESLSTVGKRQSVDLQQLSREQFMSEYGHLRPGTYEVTSPTYQEMADDVFASGSHRILRHRDFSPSGLSGKSKSRLAAAIKQSQLDYPPQQLFSTIREVIEQREVAKFEFTRLLAYYLDLVVELCGGLGISRDEASFLTVPVLTSLTGDPRDDAVILSDQIQRGTRQYKESLAFALPEVLTSADEIGSFLYSQASPNFVTSGAVTAAVAIEVSPVSPERIDGKIAVIESADPGYDWIFSRPIAGLITCWGGANSHMAIRCNELGVPAAIGVGPVLFKGLTGAELIHLDCSAALLEIVR
jgi:hypothetical protein